MSTVITVSNQKGGVGKTTTCAALIASLGRSGRRVLGVDLDPQGNLGFCLGVESAGGTPTVLEVLNGTLNIKEAILEADCADLLVSDISLSSSGLEKRPKDRERVLKAALDQVAEEYDYIVIDTPPALNLLTVNAYTASDFLIIPMASDILSLVGLSQLKETVESVKRSFNPGLEILGILLNRYNARTLLSRDVKELAGQLAEQMGTKVFEAKIRSGVAIAEAPAHGMDIFEYNSRSGAVKDYEEFFKEAEADMSRRKGR